MAEAKSEKPAISSKKLLLIIVAAVVILAIGGGAAFYMISQKKAAAAEQAAEDAADEGKAADGHDTGETKKKKKKKSGEEGPPVFENLKLPPVNLSGEYEAVAGVAFNIHFTDAHAKDLYTAYLPKIRGDLLLLLSSKTGDELKSYEGKLKFLEEVKARINAALAEGESSDAESHGELVEEVLFDEIIIQ